MTYFDPSISQARACRTAMDNALWASVRSILADQPGAGGPDPDDTGPLDYGAYFDLVLKVPGNEELPQAARDEAVAYLAARIGQAGTAVPASGPERPRVSNLAASAYRVCELDRLRRWWDIEPENSMGLAGLDRNQFEVARQLLAQAFDRLALAVPEIEGELREMISDIVVARSDGTEQMEYGGATSFALWGAFTINAARHDSWPHYYRTIVHEGAHNLLFGIARNEPLVADDPQTRLVSPLRDDLRPVDGIYHAAFVSARESLAFDRILCLHEDTHCLDEAEADLLTDLLESSVLAFHECDRAIELHGHLTPLGKTILDECREFMLGNFAIEAN